MPPTPFTTRATVWEGGNATCMARIRGEDGAYIQQADIASISRVTYDLADTSSPDDTSALTVANVVFDTLQTSDPRWTVDSTGFNFLAVVPSTLLADPRKTYRVEFIFTDGGGAKWPVIFELKTSGVLSL